MLYDNGPNADDRVIMFTTNQNLSLSISNTWFVDENFGQTVVHRSSTNKFSINHSSLLYTYFRKKNQSTYEQIFSIILNQCQARNL